MEERSEKKRSKGWVYFMQAANGLVKIGRATRLDVRICALQTMSPVPLEFIHAVESEDPVRLEQEYHLKFGRFRAHGEWFALKPDQIDAIKRTGRDTKGKPPRMTADELAAEHAKYSPVKRLFEMYPEMSETTKNKQR